MRRALAVLALLGPAAIVRASEPSPGDVVASVAIDAAPDELPRLAPYVELKRGDAFDPAAVRHSVELLYATGRFEDVIVEAGEATDGVALLFRPVPAPLFAAVRVQGDAILKPGALRRITRLRAGEPLWPERLERAARAAARALVDAGYLEAQVHATALRTAAGADAVFSVHAGPRVRVGRVDVEGVEAAQAGLLRGRARPAPGEVFSRPRARKAAESMRKQLVSWGFWKAGVEPVETYDGPSARLDLTFRVAPGLHTAVEFRGSRLPSGTLGSLEDLLKEGALRGDVIEEVTDRLEQAFRRRGHRDVFVSHSQEEPRAGQEVLVYVIEAGPEAVVASVRLSGADSLGAEARHLEALVSTRPGLPLEDRVVDEDVRNLTRAVQSQGYAEAKVETEIPDGGGSLPVVFRIQPGPRTFVRFFDVQTPAPLPGKALPAAWHVKAGEPYRVSDVALDRNALLTAYRDAGFPQPEVTPEVTFSDDKTEARVVLRVSPGVRIDVDHIVVAGLRTTRPVVVQRELLIKEGEPLGFEKVLESQRRLGALGIFQRVSINELDPEAERRRSLIVAAEEAPRTTFAYGIGYAERDLLRGSFEVTRRNLFGMDRTLSAFARASFAGSRLLATFEEPYLFNHKLNLFLTGFREEEARDGFSFVREGGLVQTAFSLSPRLSLILRLGYQQTFTFDVTVPLDEVDRQFLPSTFSGPSASLVDDTRNDPLDPGRGHFMGADIQYSTVALGGDSFVKAFLQAATYHALSPRLLLALSGRLGLARTFGGEPPRLPLPDRYFAGGDYSLRGFKIDTAGPLELSTSGELVPTGGNALLLGGAELRILTGSRLSGAVFTDAGNVYPLVSDLSLGDVRYTAGLGVRYRTAVGPLRVDWGYKLNRRSGESPYRFHFTVGHAF